MPPEDCFNLDDDILYEDCIDVVQQEILDPYELEEDLDD
jgi:hypothetical protein